MGFQLTFEVKYYISLRWITNFNPRVTIGGFMSVVIRAVVFITSAINVIGGGMI